MAEVLTRTPRAHPKTQDELPEVREASAEELYSIFDRRAQEDLGVSGDEFLRAWFAGEWEGKADPDAISCAMLVPFVEEHWRQHVGTR
jgi:hypothetical protein